MSLRDAAETAVANAALHKLEMERDDWYRKAQQAATDLRALRSENADLRRENDELHSVDALLTDPPKWQYTPAPGVHRATACATFSDLHYGEVVRPREIDGYNAYNERIALKRTRSFFDKFALLAKEYVSGLTYDGFELFMPGDNFTGVIHDELAETNDQTLQEALVFWLDPVEAGLSMLADVFGHGRVNCEIGNHTRDSKKPRAKGRARHNWDWNFYRHLQRDMARLDPRVEVNVSDAMDLTVPIYRWKFLLTHGDQFPGGSGISGKRAPLSLGEFRKTLRQQKMGKPYDVMVIGHWHEYDPGTRLIVSGALKGYDEFAYSRNYTPAPPQLAFWISTPERPIMFQGAIEPMDRKAERW